MKTHRIPPSAALLSLLLLASGPARADEPSSAGGYLRLDGGFNLATDQTLKLGGATGTLSLNTGYRLDLGVGYDLNGWVALGVEAGFFHNSADSLIILNQSPPLSDTWVQGIPLLATVFLRYPNPSDFVPYIGGGVGGVVSMMSLQNQSDTQVVFAWQVSAGLMYKLGEQGWLDLGYKFLALSDPEYHIGGIDVKASNVRNHFLGVCVTWRL